MEYKRGLEHFQSHNGLILASATHTDNLCTYSFQSHNGLILAKSHVFICPLKFHFQSHNGLILAWNGTNSLLIDDLSIPQWSDFSPCKLHSLLLLQFFQSHNGLILAGSIFLYFVMILYKICSFSRYVVVDVRLCWCYIKIHEN